MPATATGRGAQVILDGDAQKAARGAYAPTYIGNFRYLENLENAGQVADSDTSPDGRTKTGAPAADYVVGVSGGGATGNLSISSVNTQPTTDYIHNQILSQVNYTANATGGDTLGLVSYMAANANGFTVSGVAGHTSAIYGNAFAGNTGSVYQVNGVMGVSGNAGSGTLVNGVDFFGHGAYNTGGGTITNHYFLYQEASTAATHEYGAFFSAPVGIGTTAPDYNLRVGGAGGALSDNWLYIGGGFGAFSVTSNGASLFPGFNPGAGGFGCLNLIVGNNGTAEATTSTAAFLYVSACAGTPTGVPPLAAVGRVAMRYDTTAHKLWMHDGTVWRGIVLT